MSSNMERRKARLLKKVAKTARSRNKGQRRLALERFVRRYYEHVPPQDVVGTSAEDLYAAAAAHWGFAAERRAGTAKTRVYNPRRSADGWDCERTVVEVVNDDMPFLVDSVTAALNQQDLTVHLVIHPIITARRARNGRWLEPIRGDEADAVDESFMRFEVTPQSGDRLQEICERVESVLWDVCASVTDWQLMRDRLSAIIDELNRQIPGVDVEQTDEVRDFLRWAHDDHFTFLGFRDYDYQGATTAQGSITVKPREGLGVLRGGADRAFSVLGGLDSMSPEVRAFVRRPDLLMITKSSFRSTVHRPVQMDAIGVKRLDTRGRVAGQRLFVGLFTSSAYNRSPHDIPLLRSKLRQTIDRAGFPRASHNNKALVNILETYPRDELFQISEEQLLETSLGILNLQERQRVALFVRPDDFERFMSCMIYVPRESYTTALRQRMQTILEEEFAGTLNAHYIQLGAAPLARLHVLIDTTPGQIPKFDVAAIEERLVEASRSWTDHLLDALIATHGEVEGAKICDAFADAFPFDYRQHYGADAAVKDIAKFQSVLDTGVLAMDLHRPEGQTGDQIRLKFYRPELPIPLSDVLPMLEHMGLKVVDELPHSVTVGNDGTVIWIHDFGLETRLGNIVDLKDVQENFEDTFLRVWQGDVESDGFNALVLGGGLAWREVVVLRALCKFLRQAGIAFSQTYMEQTLINNPALARRIVQMFLIRFDPRGGDKADGRAKRLRRTLMDGLDAVASADEDRILRRFINAIDAMLRTNFFQQTADGEFKSRLSFKFDSEALEELPLPRPLREIFVYSPRIEGVHLRFGMVARGGLRWSDRREDFRTEVLGLVKAQQVKNAVIVPVGSKGGFVVKRPPEGGDREAFMAEGIACYKTFISGLLDITDNLKGNRVVPPKDVRRLDGDDPYLVVAADKGTATFSDIANGVSEDYGFWLGDAFASGGSAGYDHKKMGITARGAWESVKRHFREIGVDTQSQAFSVVGVGDMSGDVFGNGMLLSRHIRLVAAFNHLHIFLDPDPDTAKSFAERKRLFDLPRSGWNDYNTKLISKGGGVYDRSAKSIPLTAEVRKMLGVTQTAMTPNDLLRAILQTDVDLMWFGGIGTYIKAAHESDAEVGDRANDAIRIIGSEVRAKVIGEGANLGVTQQGRIEYALSGGRLNADSIDNSAGVDCSDHEVNIKILVDSQVAGGAISAKQRNPLLARMTDEVGDLCLVDNYQQSQAITVSQSLGVDALDDQIRLMRMLERADILNRSVEFLPDDEFLEERAQRKIGLTRPEIGVLLSYSKNWLYAELVESDLPDDPHLAVDLVEYFPTQLHDKHAKAVAKHRLRREIVATAATNTLVNRAGETFVTQFMEKTGKSAPEITRAFLIGSQVFALRELWDAVEALDNKVPAQIQTALHHDIHHLLDWVTLWFLLNGADRLDLGDHVSRFKDGIRTLSQSLDSILPPHYVGDRKVRGRPYVDKGVPEALALRIAGLVNLFSGCDIVSLANRRRLPVARVAKLYFAVGTRFGLGRLRAAAEGIDLESHWQRLAVEALIEEIYGHQLKLSSQVLDLADGKMGPGAAIERWSEQNSAAVEQTEHLLGELRSTAITDVSMVAVASRQLRALTATGA